MKLTYKDLKKREVINVLDGKSFGSIVDLELDFPKGILTGIMVQGKKTCRIFSCFNRTQIFIPQNQILKIGGDVILVSIRCGDTCSESININQPRPPKKCSPCPPLCSPPNHCSDSSGQMNSPNIADIFDDENYNKF